MANRDISRHVAALSEFGLRFLNGGGDLLTARFRIRVPVPEPNSVGRVRGRSHAFTALSGRVTLAAGCAVSWP